MKYNFFVIIKFILFFFLKKLQSIYILLVNKCKKVSFNYFKTDESYNYKKFLRQNETFYQNKEKQKQNSSKGVLLVTNLVPHPGYFLEQITVSKYLEKILNLELIQLTSINEIICVSMCESSGIKKTWYFDTIDFFKSLKFFIKSLKILSLHVSVESFCQLEINKVKIGEIVHDHFIRFTGIPNLNVPDLHSFKLCYFLSIALKINEYADELFKKKNIKAVAITETQFIPSAIFFQKALANKCKVYSRQTGPKFISVRVYSNNSEIYSKDTILKDFFEHIFKHYRKQAVIEGGELIIKRYNNYNYNKSDFTVKTANYFEKNQKKDFTKEEICNRFNWDVNNPIMVIFDHDYLDGIYKNGRTLFRDNVTWIRETLEFIKKIKKINWLIKRHPINYYLLQKAKSNTEKEYKKIIGNGNNDNEHIQLFPKEYNEYLLPNIVSGVLGQGTVGYEYPCFGIPAILANRTYYSRNGFTYEPKTKEEYFDYVCNIHKINKLDEEQIDRAKVFAYIFCILTKVNCPLVPQYKFMRDFYYQNYPAKFWQECTDLLKNYKEKNDLFKIMLKKQIKSNNVYTINYNLL